MNLKFSGNESVKSDRNGWYLIQMMMYVGILFIVTNAVYRYFNEVDLNSRMMARSAQNLTQAVNHGNRWRAHVRSASRIDMNPQTPHAMMLEFPEKEPMVYYFSDECLWRTIGLDGRPTRLLSSVRSLEFIRDEYPEAGLTGYRMVIEFKEFRPATLNKQVMEFTAVPGSGVQMNPEETIQ